MNRSTMGALVLALAVAMSLASALPASAAGQWGVAGFAGYNSFDMKDVNNAISEANADLEFNGYSQRIDDIKSGLGFGGGLRYRTFSGLIISVDYERLTASSDVTISGSGLEVNADGNAFTGTVNYLFPSTKRTRFGIAAGIGYYTSSGSISAYDNGMMVSINQDLSGNGLGFHGAGTADVALGQVARLEVLAGYRYAKATDIEVAGATSNDDIDWSGFMSRVGLAFYFGAQ